MPLRFSCFIFLFQSKKLYLLLILRGNTFYHYKMGRLKNMRCPVHCNYDSSGQDFWWEMISRTLLRMRALAYLRSNCPLVLGGASPLACQFLLSHCLMWLSLVVIQGLLSDLSSQSTLHTPNSASLHTDMAGIAGVCVHWMGHIFRLGPCLLFGALKSLRGPDISGGEV